MKPTAKGGQFMPVGTTRYIKCRVKLFQYPNTKAAEAALPRIHRADPAARLVPPEEEYDLLKATPSADVVIQKSR